MNAFITGHIPGSHTVQGKHDSSLLGSSAYVDAGQGTHVVVVSAAQGQ